MRTDTVSQYRLNIRQLSNFFVNQYRLSLENKCILELDKTKKPPTFLFFFPYIKSFLNTFVSEQRQDGFLVTDKRVINEPLGSSLCSFACTTHSVQSLVCVLPCSVCLVCSICSLCQLPLPRMITPFMDLLTFLTLSWVSE